MSRGLLEVLEEARSFGFLGPGPVRDHLDHASGFARAALSGVGAPPPEFADLGSGGGVPALVLLAEWSETQAVLVESLGRRARFLEEALHTLGWADRARVVTERAEVVARDPGWREHFMLVTARSFGPPAVTAEIAAGLVAPGGVLVVSEPPEANDRRWPVPGLELLGFGPAERTVFTGAHFVRIPKNGPVPEDRPRPTGRPGKRPLW